MIVYQTVKESMKKPESSRQHRLYFKPVGIWCVVKEGQTILDVAVTHGIDIRSDCGGKGRCGKCRVVVSPADSFSPLSHEECQLLSPKEIGTGERLACQARVRNSGMVTIPSEATGTSHVYGKTKVTGVYPVDAMVKRVILQPHSHLYKTNRRFRDTLEEILARARASGAKGFQFRDIGAIRQLSQLFTSDSAITLVCHRKKGITAVIQGQRERSMGFALDIGTTTLAAYLCDLRTGAVLASAASSNPQRRFGEDVISRVAFAKEHDDGTEILRNLVIDEVNKLMQRCLKAIGASLEDVDEVVVVGNTTMEQIFAGLHPGGLGSYPFLPVCRFIGDLRAADLGLNLNPATNVHLFPVISGFVGGDTLGVILSERPHERDDISLIVDIGTNGEVVLGNRHRLWVTSCATGPALEGAHIDCGMRATPGAIHRVDIDPSTYTVSYSVLGKSKRTRPKGICGSGVIDAVAAMGRSGLLNSNGQIKAGLPGVMCDDSNGELRFVLVPREKSATGREIFLSQSDIRQIQLAKGALATGIKLLMEKSGIKHIDRMVLTGAFGARFDWKNGVYIGMLPEPFKDTFVKVVENAAGVGAIIALLDQKRRKEASELVKKIHFLELAGEQKFWLEFAMAMRFPFDKN